MAETAEELFRRARGHLTLPPLEEWDTFPFEGELRVRPLLPPVTAEPPRAGAGGVGCARCSSSDNLIWSDGHWLVGAPGRPTGLPVIVLLYPRAHHDLDDLPAELAAELGPMILRVEAAVRSVGEVGRVHVCRWGDGSEHLHWWFMARPARLPQLVGSFAAIWDDILPPVPETIWRESLTRVATTLAAGGGTAHPGA